MGFHICPYDKPGETYLFSNLSSGDTTLIFENGHAYEVPDMILHYIADHHFSPPNDFIDDVMSSKLVDGKRLQTKAPVLRVGYLKGEFPKGYVPNLFITRLELILQQANALGHRIQYRGLP